ncbi:uncharacterized protein [Haliotis asinina]|uniref:uncharacterized protein n=1 Tax=Haliotis asinina TaxID=109174 RepID=UPI0035319B93
MAATATEDAADPVLTSLRNILRGLEDEERDSSYRRKQLRLVAAARRDRMYSAPELNDSGDDGDKDDVDAYSQLPTLSWRLCNTSCPSYPSRMNGHLRPSPSQQRPTVRSGSSLKRNSMVHDRPRRINGLSVSADRITLREAPSMTSEKSPKINGQSRSYDQSSAHSVNMQKPKSASPKRRQAPPPPPLPQTSPPSPRQVCSYEVTKPDQSGWLLDQLRGEKVWCVVADMLFCVFQSDTAESSKDVIFLPGCRVRSLVFNSAKRDNLGSKDCDENTKTITGVDRYQFYIENVSIRRKYLFGVKCKTNLDEWVDVLTRACDIAVFDNCANQSRDSDGWDSADDSVFSPANQNYYPSPTRSRRMSMISMSLRDSDLSDSDFRKRLRKETDDPKVAPVKGIHIMEAQKQPKKSRSFLKLKSFGSLDSLLKRKRSRSADRAATGDSHSLDETKSLNIPDSPNSDILDTSVSSRPVSSSQSFLSRSWDSGKSSGGLGSSIRRRASDLKDKMFGGGKPTHSSRTPGLRLRDLNDIRISGHLQYKFMMRWIKVWCAVSRGCFYGFKSQNGGESPVIAVILTQSTVSYVTEPEKRNKKLYVFKLSQNHCKSIYLCAHEESELSRWLQTLQMEACRIQAEDNLALESTSDCNYSVDSALSAMSIASSHTDITDNYHTFSTNLALNSTTHSTDAQDCIPGMYDFARIDVTGRLDSTESADDWDSTSQSSTNEAPYHRYSDVTPKHDPSVSYLWGKDKGYLFQMIRAKLRKGKRGRGEGMLYDREVCRSEGEGSLLVIHDDDNTFCRKLGPLEVKAGRTKSFGDPHTPWIDSVTPEDKTRGGRARPRPLAVTRLPAEEIDSPSIAGYLERKGFNGQWIRYWYIVKDAYLYCYLTPEDQVTVDISYLHGYQVTSLIDQFRGKRFVIHLSQENYIPLYLSFESRDEMEEWSDGLQKAAQLPQDESSEDSEHENYVSQDDTSCTRTSVKQKLLAEVLRQKEELEKKQAARRTATQSDRPCRRSGVINQTLSSQTPGKLTGEDHISTVTRLKQRRLSTQIKMEAIQRQLGDGGKNGQRKSLFRIGKKKSQDDKNPQLVEQLKELSTTLKEIDINLNQEGVHTNNNVKSSKLGFHKVSTESDLLKGDSFESDDQAVQRSNSLKASVQRLAHRTFAKAGWRKNARKSQSLHIDDYNPDDPELSPGNQSQEMIDLTTHTADIISSISFSSSAELTSMASSSDVSHQDPESPLSGRSTPASSYSPRSPRSPSYPRVTSFPASPPVTRLSPRDRGLSAARSEMMTRSNSAGPTLSSSSFDGEPGSPRREVNPSIMAEIDAFEELTRKVLGQKSALTSH